MVYIATVCHDNLWHAFKFETKTTHLESIVTSACGKIKMEALELRNRPKRSEWKGECCITCSKTVDEWQAEGGDRP